MNAIIPSVLEGELLSPRAMVRVVGRTHPLSGGRIDCEMPAGLSVSEMLAEALKDRPELVGRRDFIVSIDGHEILSKNWRRVRARPGATVTFIPRLQGGTAKAIIGLVIAVAAIIVAPYLAPGLVAALGGAISIGTATSLIAGGLILAGTLAMNALFPIRQPDAAVTGSDAFSARVSIQGARNESAPFGAIPQILGTHRMSPLYAAKPYTELAGDDQFLRILFLWGYGPIDIDLSSLKIGETPLSSFQDVEIQHNYGLPSDVATSLYPSTVDEQALSIELNSVEGDSYSGLADADIDWQVRNTAPNCTFFSIDITFPEGVFRVNTENGNLDTYSSSVRGQYRVAGSGGSWIDFARDIIQERSIQTARKYGDAVVPAGQYEVRVGRSSRTPGDTAKYKTRAVWSSLRSFTTGSPVTFPKRLAMTAIRIKATDQLNGVIDTFNGVVSSIAPNAWNGAAWVQQATNNPADLFRLVLQGPANARAVGDEEIDLDNLIEWWGYCVEKGFTYNEVITQAGSVYDKLSDIAAAGRAVISFPNGKWGVIWDRPDDSVVQHFTPRNSWGFQGIKAYAQQPHGWRVNFINEENGYSADERIVYDDGYNAANATLFEGIQFRGVTKPSLIWKHGRFQIAQQRLRPEKVKINTGWEHLVCTRGDRVRVTHDVLLIGLAAGRMKAVDGQVITFDETVTIELGKSYGFKFRVPEDVRVVDRSVDMTDLAAGDYNELPLIGDLSLIVPGTLFGFGETGQETANYRIYDIAHQKDLIATLTLVDDAPEISQADTGTIPDYAPNVTIPADPFTQPPQHLSYAEIVDGTGASVRALVRLGWTLPRFGRVTGFEVQSRDDEGDNTFKRWEIVPAPATLSDIAITSAGSWSFRVRCLFNDGTVSAWATLAGISLQALSFAPGNVNNLYQRLIDGQTALGWDIVSDPRVLRYEIRKGTSWDTGLLVGDQVAQPPWPTTGDGTYHIRSYVLSPFGALIYCAATSTISVADTITVRNIILSDDEQVLGWPGRLNGGVIDGSFIRTDIGEAINQPFAQEIVDQLALSGLHIAVYVSPTIVDIGRPAECRFWTEFEAVGVVQGENFLAQGNVIASGDFLASASTRFIRAFPIWRFATEGSVDVFTPADVFAPADVFGAGVTWPDWVAIASGTRVARFFVPGFVVITDKEDVDATGTKFKWFVDVPDRTDDYTALSVPNTGLDIVFYPGGFNATPVGGTATPFNGGPNGAPLPHVQRAIVDATNGDEVKITNLTLSGCTVHVVNAGTNVSRDGVNLLIRGY
jgi:hypothetical protein